MINAKEARRMMENAQEERKKIASAYFFSQFKNFESQIEQWAKMGHNCIALRFQDRNLFYEIDDAERENIIRGYYEPLGYTVKFNSKISSVFSLYW